jgi:hypothetical protein
MRQFAIYLFVAVLAVLTYVGSGLVVDRFRQPVAQAELPPEPVAVEKHGDTPAMGILDVKLEGGVLFICALKPNLDGTHVVDLLPDGMGTLPSWRYAFLILWPSGTKVTGAFTIQPGKLLTIELTDKTIEAEKKSGPAEQAT